MKELGQQDLVGLDQQTLGEVGRVDLGESKIGLQEVQNLPKVSATMSLIRGVPRGTKTKRRGAPVVTEAPATTDEHAAQAAKCFERRLKSPM